MIHISAVTLTLLDCGYPKNINIRENKSFTITIYGLDILLLKLAPRITESDLTLPLLEGTCLLFFVVLLPCCAATDATLNAAGFCKDTPTATVGEDQEKLAFRQIPPPLVLYPPRFIFAMP